MTDRTSRRPARTGRTALYRLFNAEGELLYIGITANFGQRWTQHAQAKSWWAEVERQTVEWHPYRAAAGAAETAAIAAEGPRYNIRGIPKPEPVPHVLLRETVDPATRVRYLARVIHGGGGHLEWREASVALLRHLAGENAANRIAAGEHSLDNLPIIREYKIPPGKPAVLLGRERKDGDMLAYLDKGKLRTCPIPPDGHATPLRLSQQPST